MNVAIVNVRCHQSSDRSLANHHRTLVLRTTHFGLAYVGRDVFFFKKSQNKKNYFLSLSPFFNIPSWIFVVK
jgi:hypothetical protein